MASINAIVPATIPMFSSVAAPTTKTLQSVNDYYAVICIAEEPAVINRVTGYVDVRSSNPGTARVGIQSVNASGLPSGTWLGFSDFTANGTNFPNFSTKEWTLSTTATLTRGQYYAIVIQALSGTWNGSNNVRFYSVRGTGVGPSNKAFPYMYDVINGSAGSKTTTDLIPNLACGSSTRQYGIALSGSTVTAWNSGATPDERGMKFRLPASTCTSFQVAGVRIAVGPTNSASTWRLNLYDSANTILQQITFTNTAAYNTNTITVRDYYFDEATLATLSPATDYRISVEATSASLGCVAYVEVGSPTACSDAFIPGGTFHLTTRTNAGAWTDTTTAWFPMQLLISDLTANGGGSGASMTVGFNQFSG